MVYWKQIMAPDWGQLKCGIGNVRTSSTNTVRWMHKPSYCAAVLRVSLHWGCILSKLVVRNSWRPVHAIYLHMQMRRIYSYYDPVYFASKSIKHILIYVQQDATLHSLFYLETALHILGGTTIHHQEPNNCMYSIWYLSHRCCYLLLSVWQISDAVHTVVCAPDDGWWYHPKHVEQFPDKINCVTLHLVGHILEHSYDARTHKR
jgi:hypothetical protein